MVLTVEPIIAAGAGRIILDKDGWTIRTRDRSLAAHRGGRPHFKSLQHMLQIPEDGARVAMVRTGTMQAV